MGRKKKVVPKGKHSGVAISPATQEKMVQIYAMTQNMRETARQLKISEQTVAKYLKKIQPKEIVEARIQGVKRLHGKTHSVADRIIDSIAPDELESGKIKLEDKDGNLAGYKYWGPSLMQKITAFAILSDKLKTLHDLEVVMNEGTASGELIMPETIAGLSHGIKSKLKELKFLHIKFEDENPDLAQKIQSRLVEAEVLAGAVPAEAEIIDLRNPGKDDGGNGETVPSTDHSEL